MTHEKKSKGEKRNEKKKKKIIIISDKISSETVNRAKEDVGMIEEVDEIGRRRKKKENEKGGKRRGLGWGWDRPSRYRFYS